MATERRWRRLCLLPLLVAEDLRPLLLLVHHPRLLLRLGPAPRLRLSGRRWLHLVVLVEKGLWRGASAARLSERLPLLVKERLLLQQLLLQLLLEQLLLLPVVLLLQLLLHELQLLIVQLSLRIALILPQPRLRSRSEISCGGAASAHQERRHADWRALRLLGERPPLRRVPVRPRLAQHIRSVLLCHHPRGGVPSPPLRNPLRRRPCERAAGGKD